MVVFPVGENVLGIVTDSIELSIVIENASPVVQPMNIIWTYRNSTNDDLVIMVGGQYSFSNNRQRLTINDLTHDNEGLYIVMATNEAGSHSVQLMLNIEGTSTYNKNVSLNKKIFFEISFKCFIK